MFASIVALDPFEIVAVVTEVNLIIFKNDPYLETICCFKVHFASIHLAKIVDYLFSWLNFGHPAWFLRSCQCQQCWIGAKDGDTLCKVKVYYLWINFEVVKRRVLHTISESVVGMMALLISID